MNVVMEKVLALAYYYARECAVTVGDRGFSRGGGWYQSATEKKNLDFDLSYCIPKMLQLIEEICEQESVCVLTPQTRITLILP